VPSCFISAKGRGRSGLFYLALFYDLVALAQLEIGVTGFETVRRSPWRQAWRDRLTVDAWRFFVAMKRLNAIRRARGRRIL
jgi:hypothetical protein